MAYQQNLSAPLGISKRKSGLLSWLAQLQAAALGLRAGKQTRLPRELDRLTDAMLLDIGVDPRGVPNPAGELIPRPDLNRSGLATPIWRTTAKS